MSSIAELINAVLASDIDAMQKQELAEILREYEQHLVFDY